MSLYFKFIFLSFVLSTLFLKLNCLKSLKKKRNYQEQQFSQNQILHLIKNRDTKMFLHQLLRGTIPFQHRGPGGSQLNSVQNVKKKIERDLDSGEN